MASPLSSCPQNPSETEIWTASKQINIYLRLGSSKIIAGVGEGATSLSSHSDKMKTDSFPDPKLAKRDFPPGFWKDDIIDSIMSSNKVAAADEERVETLISEIKSMFRGMGDGETTPSAYDTAWVAKIPALSSNTPMDSLKSVERWLSGRRAPLFNISQATGNSGMYYYSHRMADWQNTSAERFAKTILFYLIIKLSKMRAHGLEVGVFVTGYKQFWGLMVTGSVLTFIEALDFIILDNYTVQLSNSVWFIPVSLSVSEGKLLKVLNLVGLFLLTKKVFWLIPSLLSIASAMLELNTALRTWLYTSIGRLLCWSVHLICDKLPYSVRRRVYSWGQWVENFQPFNDIQLRVVRSPICAVIGGGAKAHMEGATLVPWLNVGGETTRSFDCASNPVTIKCCNPDRIVITCMLFERFNKCGVAVGKPDDELADEFAVVGVDCNNRVEFMKLCTFLSCIAKNSSGSFRSYDSNNKAHVRGWKESVRHYVESGFPPVYELKFQPAIVNGIEFFKKHAGMMEDAADHRQPSGFEFVFPAMINEAKSLCLDLAYELPFIKQIIKKREAKLKRIPTDLLYTVPTIFLYYLEGLQEIVEWHKIIKLQSRDGSFISSPASTAAVFMSTGNTKCLEFLNFVLMKFGNHGTNITI